MGSFTRKLLLRSVGHGAVSNSEKRGPTQNGEAEKARLEVAILVRCVAVCLAGLPLLFRGPLLDHQLRKQIGGEAIASEDLRARERGMVNLLWLAFAGVPGGSV